MKPQVVFVLALIILASSACQAALPSGGDPLGGTAWILVSINADTTLVGNPPSLVFDGKDLSGNASCNIYRGSYQVKGDGINVGPLARTEMYCQDPEGVMEQENRYLEILAAAESYGLTEGSLRITGGGNTLEFQSRDQDSAAVTPELESTSQEEPTAVPATVAPSPTPELTLPEGWQEYRDADTGVVIYIPDDWQIFWDGVIPGEYAIFQSYPADKYTGGEGRQPGDTKCDLNLKPSTANLEELIQGWESSDITTILSDQEFTFRSGQVGRRFEIDSLGPIRVYVVDFSTGQVRLSCFGDFELVDEIAAWLHEVD